MGSRLSPERGSSREFGRDVALHLNSDATGAYPADLTPPAAARSLGLRLAPWALLLLFATLAWILRAPAMLTRQDDARYLVLARALRMGTYRDLMWPGAPWHHMYPPGFPALLAAWIAIGGERFDWLIVLHITLSALSLGVMYLAVRRGISPLIALVSLAVLAVSPRYIGQAGQVGSESSLALCFSLAIWVSVAVPRGGRQVALLIALSLLAPIMRTAGIALPAAVGLCWLSERRYRDAALLAGIGIVILGALIAWTLKDPTPLAGSSYAGDLGAVKPAHVSLVVTLLRRVMASADYYLARSVPVLMSAPTIEGTIIDNVISATLLSSGLLVGIWLAWKGFRIAALTVVFSGLLLMMWPYQQIRFLVPLAPMLVPLILLGLQWMIARIGPSVATPVISVIALVFVLNGIVSDRAQFTSTPGCVRGRPIPDDHCLPPDQASFFHAATFVRDRLPPQARILSAKSEPLYVYTGRTTLPTAFWLVRDSTSIWNGLRREGAEYILLGALHIGEINFFAPLLASHCHSLDLVASFPPHTYLFRTMPPVSDSTAACDALANYRRTVVPPPQ